jgi:hypothetical protein
VNTISRTSAPRRQPNTSSAADRHAAAAAPTLGHGCVVRRALARLLTPRVSVGYRKDALHTAHTGEEGGTWLFFACLCCEEGREAVHGVWGEGGGELQRPGSSQNH